MVKALKYGNISSKNLYNPKNVETYFANEHNLDIELTHGKNPSNGRNLNKLRIPKNAYKKAKSKKILKEYSLFLKLKSIKADSYFQADSFIKEIVIGKLGYSRSTAYRIVKSTIAAGFLEKNDKFYIIRSFDHSFRVLDTKLTKSRTVTIQRFIDKYKLNVISMLKYIEIKHVLNQQAHIIRYKKATNIRLKRLIRKAKQRKDIEKVRELKKKLKPITKSLVLSLHKIAKILGLGSEQVASYVIKELEKSKLIKVSRGRTKFVKYLGGQTFDNFNKEFEIGKYTVVDGCCIRNLANAFTPLV